MLSQNNILNYILDNSVIFWKFWSVLFSWDILKSISCDCSLRIYDNASHYSLKYILLSITRDKRIFFFFGQSLKQVNQQSQHSETQFILDSPYCKAEMICYKAGNNLWHLPHYLEIPEVARIGKKKKKIMNLLVQMEEVSEEVLILCHCAMGAYSPRQHLPEFGVYINI